MGIGPRTVKLGALLPLLAVFAACGGSGSSSSGLWCCTWEHRYSACGGGSYSAWEPQSDSFNADDYYITPQEHCSNMAVPSATSCAGDCCIYVENQNGALNPGACP